MHSCCKLSFTKLKLFKVSKAVLDIAMTIFSNLEHESSLLIPPNIIKVPISNDHNLIWTPYIMHTIVNGCYVVNQI